MFLDSVGRLFRDGPVRVNSFLSDDITSENAEVLHQFVSGRIDANETLRVGNRWEDKLTTTMRLSTYEKSRSALVLIQEELKMTRSRPAGVADEMTLLTGSNKGRGEIFGDLLIYLMFPAFQQVNLAAERSLVRGDHSRIALALRMYQLATGTFPTDLSSRAPRFLLEALLDRLSQQPIKFASRRIIYKFSSAVNNGRFETELDRAPMATSDDLVIELKTEM